MTTMVVRLAQQRTRVFLAGIFLLGGFVAAEVFRVDGNAAAVAGFALCLAVLLGAGKLAAP
jgi:hypothetical protein